ncbi:TlpA family protein disulfide reductase [Polyangium jinanense]|uniref:TlpA family protein disulfide reductase n=1 Tax=Polyangium jinanense TaxID=2829994 RepID=A0A9X3X274_9BACT|nr:TlpA family protein disulfide reductase [Polyangium jinanense]MDC3955635.1 TlpA family protein disulfide reductase [Polyangium jinanense]MDC3982277.1 TlpA family protein disulfide reductase [Polyangium jinanense]
MIRARRALLLAFLAAPVACSSTPPPDAPTQPLVRGPRIVFSYETLDGGALSTDTVAGRYTVIGFVATYDDSSHAQARFLSTLVRRHVPRINAGLVVLEPPHHKLLVESFAKVVDPPYPVAMADEATIAGAGPFQGLHHVPSVVILDPQGREVFRNLGLATADALDAALRALEQGKTPQTNAR